MGRSSVYDHRDERRVSQGWGHGQGLGKVRACLVHGLVMPSSGRTRVASRALRRSAAAMLRCPCRRRTPMARLRRLAMVLGAAPVRVWEASSAKVTSRTWCSLDAPVPAHVVGQAGGVGLGGGEAGDRV